MKEDPSSGEPLLPGSSSSRPAIVITRPTSAVFTCCILLSILMNSLLFVIPPLHGLSITIYCDSSTCCSYQSPILPGLFFTALGSSGLVLNNLVHFRVLLTTHVLCTIDLKRDMTSLPSFLVPSRWMCVN
ncbi:hypothetical protein MRX96_046892 [Rhipicephalus microplus]